MHDVVFARTVSILSTQAYDRQAPKKDNDRQQTYAPFDLHLLASHDCGIVDMRCTTQATAELSIVFYVV